ncbi:MAG: ATP-grasp domain-containing protein [Pseudomonas sp.]
MHCPFVVLAHVIHPAVLEGFLPCLHKRGLQVLLITDHAQDHRRALINSHISPQHLHIIECDVFNPLAVIETLNGLGVRPAAVFSNSDHLQTATAIVAQAFECPGKDWRLCYAAKNKGAMRERMRRLGLTGPWFQILGKDSPLPTNAPWPVVAKPREGVASLDVMLCQNASDLALYCEQFWQQQPNRALLLEAYMEGSLFTLETLGDGRSLQAIGGFDVTLSQPPHFVELSARWNGETSRTHRNAALAQVAAFGINFGVCHSEFILTAQGPMLIEINYRSIGDGREFLLDRLLPQGWFDRIIALHLGETLIDAQPAEAEAAVHYLVAERSGRVDQASVSFNHHRDGIWYDYRALHNQGDTLTVSHSNKDYLGVLRLIAPDEASLQSQLTSTLNDLKWVVA